MVQSGIPRLKALARRCDICVSHIREDADRAILCVLDHAGTDFVRRPLKAEGVVGTIWLGSSVEVI